MGKRYEAIESVARLLTSDVSDVLSSCMIDILVHILPLFAVTRHPQLSADAALTQQARYATSCYDVLLTHVPQKVPHVAAMFMVFTSSCMVSWNVLVNTPYTDQFVMCVEYACI